MIFNTEHCLFSTGHNLLLKYYFQYHIAGITAQESDDLIIDPVEMGWKSFSVKNIWYRNHNIDIEYTQKKE